MAARFGKGSLFMVGRAEGATRLASKKMPRPSGVRTLEPEMPRTRKRLLAK